jgi:hypothetical protein
MSAPLVSSAIHKDRLTLSLSKGEPGVVLRFRATRAGPLLFAVILTTFPAMMNAPVNRRLGLRLTDPTL